MQFCKGRTLPPRNDSNKARCLALSPSVQSVEQNPTFHVSSALAQVWVRHWQLYYTTLRTPGHTARPTPPPLALPDAQNYPNPSPSRLPLLRHVSTFFLTRTPRPKPPSFGNPPFGRTKTALSLGVVPLHKWTACSQKTEP